MLLDRLEAALGADPRGTSTRLAVLYLDLDRFKTVNDNLGHERRRPAAHVVGTGVCRTRCGRPTAWPGSAATSSPPSCPTSTTRRRRCRSPDACSRRSAEPVDLGEGDLVTTVSIGIAGRRRRRRQRRPSCCAAPTSPCTRPRTAGRARVESYDDLGRPTARARADGGTDVPIASADGLRPAAVPPRPARPGARRVAAAVPGGIVDASVGTPVDPMPAVVLARARRRRGAGATGYPATIGSAALPRGGGGVDRAPLRLPGRPPTRWSRASAPRSWWRRCHGRCRCATRRATPCSTRRVAYPTYEMGALLAGLRRGAGAGRRRVAPRPRRGSTPPTPARALVLWLNDPSNPTGVTATPGQMRAAVDVGAGRAASSSPATSATPSSPTTPTACPARTGHRARRRAPTACSRCTRCRSARTWPGLRVGLRRRRPRPRRLPRRGAQARRAR